jgi:hypothetical protein
MQTARPMEAALASPAAAVGVMPLALQKAVDFFESVSPPGEYSDQQPCCHPSFNLI